MARHFDEANRKKAKYGTRKAALAQGHKRYFTGLPCINGHVAERQVTSGACVVCSQQKADANREKRRLAVKKSTAKNKEKNAAKRKESYAAYKKRHSEKVNARNALRSRARLHRTPCWLTADDLWIIEQAYVLAKQRTKLFGFPWHVDHVIPLRGRKVSGLHVPTNLQVIPGTDNLRKMNKYEVLS